MINEDVRHIIEPELAEGEELLWAGRPAGLYISVRTLYAVVVSVIWVVMTALLFGGGAFAILTDDGTLENGFISVYRSYPDFRLCFWLGAVIFTAASIYVVSLALYLLIRPSLEKYAITNLRGIIIRPFVTYRIINLSFDQLKNYERTGSSDLGTLTFKLKNKGVLSFLTRSHQTEATAFHKIRNTKQVENLINRTFKDTSHE